MTTVVVSGALGNRPGNGGGAWVRLNWILGLQALGFRVHFIEQIRREACVDETGTVIPLAQGSSLVYFRKVVERFGLAHSAALVYDDGTSAYGLNFRDLQKLAQSAHLLINLSGHLTIPALWERFRRKAYVDLDPGFTQIWHASGTAGSRLEGHDAYFTVGANLGTPDCPIPTCGITWRPIRPPVVLEQWPMSPVAAGGRFTTVASWRGPYGPLHFEGKTLGLKVHEFRKFLELPQRVAQPFELALRIHPAEERDLKALRLHGWQLVDPDAVAGDPDDFRRYVQGSAAEFSASQGVYVETNSGWFSDRTVEYLASGKPALVQDTGFSRHFPMGEGLLAFRTLEEAVAGAEEIGRHYDRHCRAARALAETCFDSHKVLGRLVEETGIAS
jgi:hypothetical protein